MLQKAQDVSLTHEEKNALRTSVVHFMHEHPAPAASSLLVRMSFMFTHVRYAVPVALIFMLVVGSGTAYAAEGALPGQPLYGVKVGVNEKVAIALASTPEAKTKVIASQALRRITEAQTLVARGQLDATTTAEVTARFEEKSQELVTRIAELDTEKNHAAAAHISAEFEGALDARYGLFVGLSERATSTKPVVAQVKERIKKQLLAVSDQRIAVEAGSLAQDSSDARGKAESSLSKAEDGIALADAAQRPSIAKHAAVPMAFSARTKAVAADTVEASSTDSEGDMQLSTARQYIDEGNKKLKSGQYQKAFILFEKAHRAAQDARTVFVEQHSNTTEDTSQSLQPEAGENDTEKPLNDTHTPILPRVLFQVQ